MKKTVIPRLLSLVLCLALCLPMVPGALAAETEAPEEETFVPEPTEEPAEEAPAEEPPVGDDAPGVPEGPAEEAPAEETPVGDDAPGVPEEPAEEAPTEETWEENLVLPDEPTRTAPDASEWTVDAFEGQLYVRIIGYSGQDADVHFPASFANYKKLAIWTRLFSGNKQIRTIELTDNVHMINDYAFSDTDLTELVLPETIRSLGTGILDGNTLVVTLRIPASIQDTYSPLKGSGVETLVFENGLSFIPNAAAQGACNLRSVSIPESVTEIGERAFSGCICLERIDLPDGVTEIGGDAFSGTGLTAMTLPGHVRVLGGGMLHENTGVKELSIPKTVQTAKGALSGSGVERLVFENGLTRIPDRIADFAERLEVVVIPESVTEIGERAFSGCGRLQQITIPRGTTYIDATAFIDSGLQTICGVAGSCAEVFAREHNLRFVNVIPTPAISGIINTTTGPRLTWGVVSTADKYAVYRKAEGDSRYTRYAITTNTSYTDKNAVDGVFYSYRIWSMDNANRLLGEWSGAEDILCQRSVTRSSISAKNTADGIKISWEPISGVAKYAVYRKSSGESKYTRQSISAGISYLDKNAVNGVFYYYRVWGMDSSNKLLGEWSAARGITCIRSVVPVLSGIINTEAGIKLTWNPVPGMAKYAVYRKVEGGSKYTRYAVTASTSYIDRKTEEGTFYYYRVWSMDASSVLQGDWSTVRGVTRTMSVTPVITLGRATDGIRISWEKVFVEGVAQYGVYRKSEKEGKYILLAITADTTYVDKTAPTGSVLYRVWSMDAAGNKLGAWSNARNDYGIVTENGSIHRAILVGESYAGTPDEMPGVERDVTNVSSMLEGLAAMNWDIRVAMDADSDQFRTMINNLARETDSDDVTLFYFRGRGIIDYDDTDYEPADFYDHDYFTQSGALVLQDGKRITMSGLAEQFNSTKGKVVVVLDSSGSGAAIRFPEEKNQEETYAEVFNRSAILALSSAETEKAGELIASKRFVITSCGYDQSSFSTSYGSWLTLALAASVGYDIRSHSWSDNLRGDDDGDGILTWAECSRFVKSYVSPYDVQVNPVNNSFACLYK